MKSIARELMNKNKCYWAVIGLTCGEDEIVSLWENEHEAADAANQEAETSEEYVSVRVRALV